MYHVNTPPTCKHCGLPRALNTHRKGYCSSCYQRRYRGTLTASPCGVCGEQWRAVLRIVELADGPVSLCGNHALVAGRRAWALEELRAHCPDATDIGDRRHVATVAYSRGAQLRRAG